MDFTKYSSIKRKWFNKCLLNYEIFFYGYKEYGDNYTLIEYAQGAPSLVHRHRCEDVQTITKYFEDMNPCERFFEARRVEFKHKKENKTSYIEVYFDTKKTKNKELQKLL